MGGCPPLGYEARDRKLVIVPHEAETVRHIFQRYLELGSVFALREHLRQEGITSKLRTDRNGRTTGGKPFARGALYHMLKTRIYLGEIVHKGSSYPDEHAPIVDRALWDAVAKQLQANTHDHRISARAKDQSLLSGIVFDGDGGRLTPSEANKAGRRYRYYDSESLIRGPRAASPSGRRIPARDLEELVLNTIGKFLRSSTSVLDALSTIEMQLSKEQALCRSGDWLAVEAVLSELVSYVIFPVIREFIGKISQKSQILTAKT
jgi:site-specific DNA recombinase